MKSTKTMIAAALMSLSAVMATTSFAQSTLSRADVEADLQAYQQSGLAAFDRGDITPDTSSADYQQAQQRYQALRGQKVVRHALSRADVEADLQAYQQSGLAAFDRGDITPDTNGAAYQQALQQYQQLRGIKTTSHRVTRAAVDADLKAYEQSGLADFSAGNRQADEFSPAYQQAVAKYNALRSHS